MRTARAFVQHSPRRPPGIAKGRRDIVEAGAADCRSFHASRGHPGRRRRRPHGFLVEEHDVAGMAARMVDVLTQPQWPGGSGAPLASESNAVFDTSGASSAWIRSSSGAPCRGAARRASPCRADRNGERGDWSECTDRGLIWKSAPRGSHLPDQKYATGSGVPRHYRADRPTGLPEDVSMLGDNLAGQRVLEYGGGTADYDAARAAGRRGCRIRHLTGAGHRRVPARGAQHASPVRGGRDARERGWPTRTIRSTWPSDSRSSITWISRRLSQLGACSDRVAARTLPNRLRLIRLSGVPPPHAPVRTPDETPIDLLSLRAQLRSFSRFEHHDQLFLATASARLLLRAWLRGCGPSMQRS